MNSRRFLRRQRKLIKPRLQVRLIGSFIAIVAIGMGLQAALFTQQVMEMATEMSSGGSYVEGQVPTLIGWTLASSFLVLLPLTVGVGVVATFRLAGPIYRFERYLEEVARGGAQGPCRIRRGDDLQELCERINQAIEALRAESSPRREAPEADEERTAA